MDKLPEHVVKNVESIINLQTQQEKNIPTHQRTLEAIASAFGQPWFLYAQIILFITWSICSYLAQIGTLGQGIPQFDLHDQGLDAVALLISTGVLIYQTRQEKLNDERSHLVLQLNLLTEQKITKLIALVEELRVDLPDVRNRYDLEAELMQKATDPQAVFNILQETLQQVSVEANRQISEKGEASIEPESGENAR
jgi:uncharacterized membrane protein